MAEFKLGNITIPEELPLVALKNTVLFPKVVVPLIVQRPKSVGALDNAMTKNRFVRFFPTILPEIIYMMMQLKDTEQIISLMTVNMNLAIEEQQRILELQSSVDALRELNVNLIREQELMEPEKNVTKETKKQIGKMQKELFLREQLKSIEKELGVEDEKEEIDVLKSKIMTAGMPKEVQAKAVKELVRLGRMPSFNPEVSYLRTYLDWLVELPLSKKTKEKINIKE